MSVKLPVDSLLEELHRLSIHRTRVRTAIQVHSTAIGKLAVEEGNLDDAERDIIGALEALGLTFPTPKGVHLA